MFNPTSLPNRLMTSRRFMLLVSAYITPDYQPAQTDLKLSVTIHRCPRCSNVRSRRTICFLSSGSASFSFLSISASFLPATYLTTSAHSLSISMDGDDAINVHALLTSDDLDGNFFAHHILSSFPVDRFEDFRLDDSRKHSFT